MSSRASWIIAVLLVALSPRIGTLVWGISPPPILNKKNIDDTGVCYSGLSVPGNDDCDNSPPRYAAWDYYEGGCGPEIPCEDCSSYVAFGVWYYQDWLLDQSGTPYYSDSVMEKAPLYLDNWTAAYGDDPPTPMDIQAKLFPIQGLDALRYIPVEAVRAAQPPVASARYGISIEVNGTEPPNATVGAMFWITAIYDESVFDVRVNGWEHRYYDPYMASSVSGQSYSSMSNESTSALFGVPSTLPQFSTGVDTDLWYYLYLEARYGSDPAPSWYRHSKELPSGRPMMFVDGLLPYTSGSELRRDSLPITPDYIRVRLRDGRRLEELGGRKVELILHTLSWAGDSYWCSPAGDQFHYSRTSHVLIGADLDEKTNDWSMQPTPLNDECVPPSFSKMEDRSTEADITGARVVKDLNVDPPSIRVGLNCAKVNRTVATTLANDAVYYPFGYYADNPWDIPLYTAGFIAFNLNGVWCCVSDLPGWYSHWANGVELGEDALTIEDGDCQRVHMYFTINNDGDEYLTAWDYLYAPAKLQKVYSSPASYDEELGEMQREYLYWNNDITQPVTYQVDHVNGDYIQYLYDTVNHGNGNELRVTLSGNGERIWTATFGAWPTIPDDPGSCPLLTWTDGSGSSSREYEWYAPSAPPTAYDGKLKAITSVSENERNVLATFEYDTQGRLRKRTRGSGATAQTVATYTYSAPATQPGDPLPDQTMDARFYVDDDNGPEGKYQLVRRTFNPAGQVTKIEEFQHLQENGSEDPPVSVTTYDYCPVPEDTSNLFNNVFYQHCFDSRTQTWYWVGRCVIKTLPANHAGNQVAEYTQYDADQGFNVANTFLAPPPSVDGNGVRTEPTEESMRNWMSYGYGSLDSFFYFMTEKFDRSRESAASGYGCPWTAYVRDSEGFPMRQVDPIVVGVDEEEPPTQMWQWWQYVMIPGGSNEITDVDHSKVWKHTHYGPNDSLIETTYDYDTRGNVYQKTDSVMVDDEPTASLIWSYGYNSFGQKTKEVDPDDYVRWTEFDPDSGLLAGTCVSKDANATSPASGPLLQQTRYTYENGMVKTIRVANENGPFTYKSEGDGGWIETVFGYDIYGRLTSKTVIDGQSQYTTTYGYDRQDRLTKITFPDNRRKEITRDGRGQITQIDYYGTGGEKLTSAYKYDDAGNLTNRTTEACPECGPLTTYKYDLYNRRTEETRTNEVTP